MSPLDVGTIVFGSVQIFYALSFLTLLYFLVQPVNWVDISEAYRTKPADYPYIVLFYPVLKESLETMRTTFLAIGKMNYPKHKYRVVAIPNKSDEKTVEYLNQLAMEFSFLEVLLVPATDDPSWQLVWDAWDKNPGATWWHSGAHQGNRNLPPKKTRQMIYAFYKIVEQLKQDPKIDQDKIYLDYIDADSAPQENHFLACAAGIKKYDVLQCTNIAGNLLQTLPASWMAMDHLNWDARLYPHMSADGYHPWWVLGKGLFFNFNDLISVGGFDPWVAIEDPDIGLRLSAQGKTIGIIKEPLIEEVPVTLERCIIQRKRWICGFFQATFGDRKLEGMPFRQKVKAVLNLVPVMSLMINVAGLPVAAWAIILLLERNSPLPPWLFILSMMNIIAYLLTLAYFYLGAWQNTRIVIAQRRKRLYFLFRVNPVFLWVYWLIWVVPILIGLKMFFSDGGLVWQRTEKIDANHSLVRNKLVSKQEKSA